MRRPRDAALPACSSSTRPSPRPTAGTRSRTRNTNTMFDIVRQNPAASHTSFESWIQRPLAEQIFAASGLDFEQAKAAAKRRDFQPMPLKATLSANVQAKVATITSHNVVGLLPGKKYPDETVIYSGALGPSRHRQARRQGRHDLQWRGRQRDRHRHADRAGARLRPRAAPRPLGRLPRRHGRGKGPARSRILRGQPALSARARRSACSTPTRWTCGGRTKNFSICGHRPARPARHADRRRARPSGRYFTPDPHPETGGFYRSDHFSFAKVGVPAISFDSGNDLVKGGIARGEALAKEYTANALSPARRRIRRELGLHRHGRGRRNAARRG